MTESVAGALNFKDVMLAYGKLHKETMNSAFTGVGLGRDSLAGAFARSGLGFEYSGIVAANGRRVMGMAPESAANKIGAPIHLVRDQPRPGRGCRSHASFQSTS